MALQWYAARTKPLAEYAARGVLQGIGVEVFLPQVQIPYYQPGRREAPLFPGYLFIHYDLEKQGWRPLRRVPQLSGLVAFGGIAATVPDDVMAELVQRVDAINGSGGLWTRFRPGDRLRVAVGPLESVAEVVVEAKSPQARLRVLLEFLGRRVYAEVSWRDVRPVMAGEPLGNRDGRPLRRTRGGGRWIRGHGPRVVSLQPAR